MLLNTPQVLISRSHNIYCNLALEEWIISVQKKIQTDILLLYTNDPCIVLGRFQNPWKETRPLALKAHRVLLARRVTGGGTVYHDRGNLNFSFISSHQNYSYKKNFTIVREALRKLQIITFSNDRHDLLVRREDRDFKISGSAFRRNKYNTLHHGTLLIRSRLNDLKTFLKPRHDHRMEGKELLSKRSRVCNLCDIFPLISTQQMILALKESFIKDRIVGEKIFTEEEILSLPALSKIYKKSQSLEWIWGEIPIFTYSFKRIQNFCDLEVFFKVRKGRIVTCLFTGEDLHSHAFDILGRSFINKKYYLKSTYEIDDHRLNLSLLEFYIEEIKDIFSWMKVNIF